MKFLNKLSNRLHTVPRPGWAIPTAAIAMLTFSTQSMARESVVEKIDDLKWRARLFLVFTGPDDTANYETLERRLEAATCGLVDRDIVVVRVDGENFTSIDDERQETVSANALRARYEVASNDSVFLLIGKDGGVKLRSDLSVSLDRVFDIIDGMPMRRREMSERGQQAC